MHRGVQVILVNRHRRTASSPPAYLGWRAVPARPGTPAPHARKGPQQVLLTWLGWWGVSA
eukprot:3041715-Amphidinium_carterae.1